MTLSQFSTNLETIAVKLRKDLIKVGVARTCTVEVDSVLEMVCTSFCSVSL